MKAPIKPITLQSLSDESGYSRLDLEQIGPIFKIVYELSEGGRWDIQSTLYYADKEDADRMMGELSSQLQINVDLMVDRRDY